MAKSNERSENERKETDQLMELFQEVANHDPDAIQSVEITEEDESNEEMSYIELDVLDLPPRREVHGKPKNRYVFTFKNPFTRLFFVVLIVVIIIALLFYFDVIVEPFSFFYFIDFNHIIEIEYSMGNQKVI